MLSYKIFSSKDMYNEYKHIDGKIQHKLETQYSRCVNTLMCTYKFIPQNFYVFKRNTYINSSAHRQIEKFTYSNIFAYTRTEKKTRSNKIRTNTFIGAIFLEMLHLQNSYLQGGAKLIDIIGKVEAMQLKKILIQQFTSYRFKESCIFRAFDTLI